MPRGYDVWQKTFYDRAIQTSLGNALRAHYDLSEPMPDHLTRLLHELEDLERLDTRADAPNPVARRDRDRS
jgi:hypothetical protein